MRIIKLAIMTGSAAYLLSSTGPSLAQSAAQSPDTDADLRCLAIAGLALATSNNSEEKQSIQIAMTFYLGILYGRNPNVSLKPGLERVMALMKLGELEQEAERCSKGADPLIKELKQLIPVKR